MTKEKIFYGTHESEFLEVYYPDPTRFNKKIVVLYHGGFFKKEWDYTLMLQLAKRLEYLGYIAVVAEYPRVGEGYTCDKMLLSVYNSFTRATQIYPHATERIAIGHSAGGYYVLMLALQEIFADEGFGSKNFSLPTTVIAQAPITDLWRGHSEKLSDNGDAIYNFVNSCGTKEASKLVYDALSPISYEPSNKCLVHLVHGSSDVDVPIVYSTDYVCQWSESSMLRYHKLPNVNHYDVINPYHAAWTYQQKLLKNSTTH